MSNNISINSNNSNKSETQLSAETIKMIEEKRRLAIEKRKQRQAIERQIDSTTNAIGASFSQNSPFKSRPNVSLTKIKPMVTNEGQSSSNANYRKPYSSQYLSKSPYTRPNAPNVSEQKGAKEQLTATISLVSNKRFKLMVNFNADVVPILRKIESKEFDIKTKFWSFDIKDYKKLMNELLDIPSVNIRITDSVPDSVLVILTKMRNTNNITIDLKERLSSELVDELFPFQKEGVLFGIRREGRCLIADDMGLGKTIQALCLAQWFRKDWPLIIICPSSLRYQWLNSLNRWLPNISKDDVIIVKKVNECLERIPVTIISYDLLSRMRSQIAIESKRVYNMAIIDESHYIKSDSAQRTETVQLLAKSCQRVVLLSGTPALSRPMGICLKMS